MNDDEIINSLAQCNDIEGPSLSDIAPQSHGADIMASVDVTAFLDET